MILLVDIGNSSIKWAGTEDLLTVLEPGSEYYKQSQFSSVIEARWDSVFQPQRILVSNVAGEEIQNTLTHWANDRWQIGPEFFSVKDNTCGVKLAYKDIGQLGVDRWLAMIAAWKRLESTLCVVNCGTAITIDGISDTGQHLGGMILPGIHLMRHSLFNSTHGISEAENFQGEKSMADNTQQAVASGTTMAVVSLIERTIGDMQLEYGKNISCIMSGGGAQEVLQLLKSDFIYEPCLVLHGLMLAAKENL